METLSHHFLLELYKLDFSLLNDVKTIESLLLNSIEGSGATYVNHFFHQFSPQGVSGVIVIAESHLSIHTWPEQGYAALDVFTCGELKIGKTIVNNILNLFNIKEYNVQYIERGKL